LHLILIGGEFEPAQLSFVFQFHRSKIHAFEQSAYIQN
jgi:hypothetical protein